MSVSNNIKLEIMNGEGISHAIDRQLDADYGQDVKLNKSEWNTIFNLIKQDNAKENKQYTGGDTDINNGNHFVVQKGNYEITQNTWNQIKNIINRKLNLGQTQKADNTDLTETTTATTTAQEEVVDAPDEDPKTAVKNILANKNIEVSDEVLDKIAQKYPTIQAFPTGNRSLEDRVADYANGLKGQNEFARLSQAALADDKVSYKEELEKAGITDEEGIDELLAAETIDEATAKSYKEILSYDPTKEDNTPIQLQTVADAIEANDMEQFKNAFLNLGQEQISVYDKDGDDKVSYEEFAEVEKANSKDEWNENYAKIVYDAINQNKEDGLTRDEYASLIWATGRMGDTKSSEITVDEVDKVNNAFTNMMLDAELNGITDESRADEAELLAQKIAEGYENRAIFEQALKNGYNNFRQN